MLRLTSLLLAFALVALPVSAQDKGQQKSTDEKKPVAAAAGAKPSGHIAVEVVLKNEGVFEGVAKKGCLVEKCVRHQYQSMPEEQRADFGAGIRVWYYDDLLGFLFIPYRQIADVKVGKELTVDQLDALKAKVEERRQAKEAAREATAKKADADGKKADARKPGVDAVQDALLTKFPISSGFTPTRFEEIQRANVTGGVTISEQEKEWVKVFPDWLKAYKKASEPKADPAPVVAQTKNGDKPAVKPEVKAEGNLIGVKTPKAQGQSGGDGAGRGLK